MLGKCTAVGVLGRLLKLGELWMKKQYQEDFMMIKLLISILILSSKKDKFEIQIDKVAYTFFFFFLGI